MKITFVLPTYNEAENLSKIVTAVLEQPVDDLNILIVDDNSPDGTGQIAEDLKKQYPERVDVLHREGKLGLGTAYLKGWAYAMEKGADAIGQMDSDFSHPPEKVVVLAEKIKEADIVIGSRYIEGGAVDVEWPIWRKFLSAFGNLYARTILSLPYNDATGGFRLWRKETLQGMPLERVQSSGYIFQVETLYLAHLSGFKAVETPIYFADRKWGTSKMNFKIQLEAAFRVWQVLWNYRDLR